MPDYEKASKDNEPKDGEMMKDEEIEQLVGPMIEDAQTHLDSDQAGFREKASAYFKGELPDVEDDPGRSKVVMTDVRDTIMQQVPSLLRVFVGSERVVEFQPDHEGERDEAQIKTDYVNYALMRDNNGPMILDSVLKDGLLLRVGAVKWWWDDSEQISEVKFTGLLEEDLVALGQEEDLTIDEDSVEVTMYPPNLLQPGMEPPPPLYALTATRRSTQGRLRVEAVPPEEVMWSRSTRDFKRARIVVHSCDKMLHELEAMGYDRDMLEEEGSAGDDVSAAKEVADIGRHIGEEPNDRQHDEPQPEVTQSIRYDEAYGHFEIDGEVKLWKLCFIGKAHKLVYKEPVSHINIAIFTPNPVPHDVSGLSTADDTMDIQRIRSMVARGTLDSMSMRLDPPTVVLDGAVEMADLLNTERNRIVRAKSLDAVREVSHTYVGNDTLPLMQFFSDVQKKRTGVADETWLHPETLQSTPEKAVGAAVAKAQERLAYIAFVFAHTLMRDLMRGVLQTIVEHQDWVRTVELRGKFTKIDPRTWDAANDVRVNVGLGTGLVEEKVALLQAVTQDMKELMGALGGPSSVVNFRKLRNALARKAELGGWPNAEEFFGEITPEVEQELAQRMQQQQQGQQQQGDPAAMAIAQAEQMKAEAQVAQMQAQVARAEKELELRMMEMQLRDDRERDKQAADFVLAVKEMEAKHQTSLDREQINAEVARFRAALDADTKRAVARQTPPPGGQDA
jgi:hypothetical protein